LKNKKLLDKNESRLLTIREEEDEEIIEPTQKTLKPREQEF
jgi:hypothetical protein